MRSYDAGGRVPLLRRVDPCRTFPTQGAEAPRVRDRDVTIAGGRIASDAKARAGDSVPGGRAIDGRG